MDEWVNRVHCGDALQLLRMMPDEGVQMCVTSPPYWGLRDYGVEGQLGLEATPEEYVGKMVEVFREVRRVMKKDGVLWLNVGDSYAAQAGGISMEQRKRYKEEGRPGAANTGNNANQPKNARKPPPGFKAKDLIGIPWMLAFALRNDGWYLRQDIIWHKPNPMPESVRDRCTKAHEYVFLLSKSERYYFDSEAMQEPSAQPERAGKLERSFSTGNPDAVLRKDIGRAVMRTSTRNRRSVWTITTKPYKEAHFATFPPELITPCILAGSRPDDVVLDPFMGSGTTAMVAARHGRRWVGMELNVEYVMLAYKRLLEGEGGE